MGELKAGLSAENEALIESALDVYARAMWKANRHIGGADLDRLLNAARAQPNPQDQGSPPDGWREVLEPRIHAIVYDEVIRQLADRDGIRDVRGQTVAARATGRILALFAAPPSVHAEKG